ncbi:M81 family metallopeptidase [Fictibacillus fluitans]|uniref:M81 family metallopeptidase n=1 Tax=Fictibacillus fluitans TaxID=3058422 RepID=A0ABT8HTF6_9BACL|nr:M81 family metallopeptidase [Fictibacillus sp. NE201]MDN4524034.1 M81 family metallopeptidase [Fictibacillus sp. NE201]
MKILVGQVLHETNTFSNIKTTVDSFKKWEWDLGEAILLKNRGVRGFMGGVIDRIEELGHVAVPTFSASAYPTGLITEETYEILKDELLRPLSAADEYDAIVLCLHGAGVVENHDDLEGEILSAVRKAAGYKIPLVVTLDLHANVTPLMVQEADAIVGNNHYPHIDCYEIGQEAVDLAVEIVKGNLVPAMHLINVPLVIPTSATHFSPVKDINDCTREWEALKDVVDCTFYHGFPYTDLPQIGVSVVATTHNNLKLAEEAATAIAEKIWDMRECFMQHTIGPKEGIKEALKSHASMVVINETSDNPGGGTPGDGTHLLKELLTIKDEKICFACIFDPEAVERAFEAGVGNEIALMLGGKTDELHGDPILLTAYVKCLTDGQFTYTSPLWTGRKENLGKTVRLQVNNVDIIVSSVKTQVLDDEIYKLHGIDVTGYKIVALKSSVHFRACFEKLTNEIITVDSPGLSTIDFTSLPYRRVDDFIYPLNERLKGAAAY